MEVINSYIFLLFFRLHGLTNGQGCIIFVNRRSTLYLHVPHVQGGGRGLQGQEKLAALVFILLCFPFASLPFLQQPNNTRKLHEYQKYTSTCFNPKFNTHFMLTFICCFYIYISYFHFPQSMHALEMLDFFLSKFVMNTNTLKVYKTEATFQN